MTEFEVILEYVQLRTSAAVVGLELSAEAEGFVLLDVTQNSTEFARCATLAEVATSLIRRDQLLRTP
jgi:hypothetical protein